MTIIYIAILFALAIAWTFLDSANTRHAPNMAAEFAGCVALMAVFIAAAFTVMIAISRGLAE